MYTATMHLKEMSLFLIGPLILMLQLPSVAAEHQPPLICNATRQPNGSFLYQLSRSPSSSTCSRSWETENHTSIAVDLMIDSKLVQNLTGDGIIMRRCWEYLHYIEQCDGLFEEAHCRVNCSSLVNLSPSQSLPTVNSTMTCLLQGLCPNQWILISVISALVVTALVAVILWKCIPNCRGRFSYSLANGQIKEGGMEMVLRNDIV